jgi:2-keto-4-pentenoate hydratase
MPPELQPETVDPRLLSLATRQWRDYRRRCPGTYFGEPHPAVSCDEAYEVQRAVAMLRCADGDRVVGYKIGCVGAAVVEQFGMSGPIHGRLFASELRASGADLEAVDFANLAVEAEMAVRIGVAGEIAVEFPIIELHHLVFRASPRTLSELIANNGLHAGVVLAPSASERAPGGWRSDSILALVVNGVPIDSGAPWATAGGASEAVRWLRDSLAQYGCGLSTGDMILTGTSLGLHPVRRGDHVMVTIDGAPVVDCRIV